MTTITATPAHIERIRELAPEFDCLFRQLRYPVVCLPCDPQGLGFNFKLAAFAEIWIDFSGAMPSYALIAITQVEAVGTVKISSGVYYGSSRDSNLYDYGIRWADPEAQRMFERLLFDLSQEESTQ